MKLDKDSLDEALLEHLLGDQKLPLEALQDAEVAARLDALEQVLAMTEQAPVPSRSNDYGAEVWSRLESQLPAQPAPKRSSKAQTYKRFSQLAAAVLLVLLGFWAGRLQSPDSLEQTTEAHSIEINGEARERLLLAALGKHLGHTERLLTEVSNASHSSSEAVTFEGPSEQAWAEELLRTNRLYRQAALRAGQTRIASLLAELEPIFLELAHAPAAGELNDLKRRVDEKSLLFKVRITEGRLTDRRTSSL